MRMKYADQPEKFMESELGLDEEVQRLLAVAASPELYPDFVATGVIEHLMALLSHENTDIAADVLELFHELTDADAIEDSVCDTWLWAHHLSVYHTYCISHVYNTGFISISISFFKNGKQSSGCYSLLYSNGVLHFGEWFAGLRTNLSHSCKFHLDQSVIQAYTSLSRSCGFLCVYKDATPGDNLPIQRLEGCKIYQSLIATHCMLFMMMWGHNAVITWRITA